MILIFRFLLTQRADSFVRFFIWSHVKPRFYCQSMITKSQFCHGGSVLDVGDLVKVILASVIIYCFDFTVGSHCVALIGIFPYKIIHLAESPL